MLLQRAVVVLLHHEVAQTQVRSRCCSLRHLQLGKAALRSEHQSHLRGGFLLQVIVHVGNGILEITHMIIVERPAQEKCLVMRLLLQSGRSLGD